jgi:hypothetical protein
MCYISLGLMLIAFVVTIYFWKRWRLAIDPKIGKKFDDHKLEHVTKEGFVLGMLAECYKHPLEKIFPSPLPKH